MIMLSSEDFDAWADFSPQDLALMAEYSAAHDDHYAQGYRLIFKARDFDQKKAMCKETGAFKGGAGFLLNSWRAEAARAQAHQHFCHAVADLKGQPHYGFYDPAQFKANPALQKMGQQADIKAINIANGHGYLYE